MPSVFSISKSPPKKRKASTDWYQRYVKREKNENSLTDSESIHDVREPFLESSVTKSSALSAPTEDISNKDSSLTFHVSGRNPVKKYIEKSVQRDEIKVLPGEVAVENQKTNL